MYKYLKNGHYHAVPARDLSDAEWERFTANLSTRETALVVTLYEFQPGELPKRVVKRVKPEPPTDPVEPEPTEPEAPAPSPEPEPTPEPTPPEPEQPTANTANKKGGK